MLEVSAGIGVSVILGGSVSIRVSVVLWVSVETRG